MLPFTKVVSEGLLLRQADVSTAFLYGREQKEIYLELPQGHPSKKSGVWKSHASVYGLISAPLTWFTTLSKKLKDRGYEKCSSDTCLFKRNQTYVVVYVDDILYTAKTDDRLDEVEKHLKEDYKIKTTKKVEEYLGMHLDVQKHRIEISQESNIEAVAKIVGRGSTELKHALNPLNNNVYSQQAKLLDKDERKKYQSVVGQLLYINLMSRPDLTFSVNVLSRYMKEPTTYHRTLAHQIVRYLWTTRKQKLVYERKGESGYLQEGYVDATYQSEPNLKSLYGFVLKVNGT